MASVLATQLEKLGGHRGGKTSKQSRDPKFRGSPCGGNSGGGRSELRVGETEVGGEVSSGDREQALLRPPGRAIGNRPF